MTKTSPFVIFILCFFAYLILVIPPTLIELSFGFIFGVLCAIAARKIFRPSRKALNPRRWISFLLFLLGPFFIEMAKANIDVAYRIITGRIRPGIVKINPDLKNDFSITVLANSITLTPGTLTVDEKNNELFVHWINVKNPEPHPSEVCGKFHKLLRGICE